MRRAAAILNRLAVVALLITAALALGNLLVAAFAAYRASYHSRALIRTYAAFDRTTPVWPTPTGGFTAFSPIDPTIRPRYVWDDSSWTLEEFGDDRNLCATSLVSSGVIRPLNDSGRPGDPLAPDQARVIRLAVIADNLRIGSGSAAYASQLPLPPPDGRALHWSGLRSCFWDNARPRLAWPVTPLLLAGALWVASREFTRRADPSICRCGYPILPGALRCPECGVLYPSDRPIP